MKGIYVLSNPSFPSLVKIGYSDNIERRVEELNRSSAVPYAFHVRATYETEGRLLDKTLHGIIDTLNPDLRTIEKDSNGKIRTREFYEMTVEDACKLLHAVAELSGTTDRLTIHNESKEEKADAASIEESKERMAAFTFSACGIEIGAEIEYIHNPKITAKVVTDKKVEIKIEDHTETMSLSALASYLEEKRTGKPKKAIQGPVYFSYKGIPLNDLRK